MPSHFQAFSDLERYFARVTDYERMGPVRATPRAYNLKRMRRLLRLTGNPERRFRSLHIAGTKGKGSTAHFTEAILRAHGLRTGLYTSPHLLHMTERIRLDGEPIAPLRLVRVMNRLRPVLDRVRPTYFEIMTAAAFWIFAQEGVDVAVIEVGIGGRLDCTNVIRPEACAITRIDYDHMQVLGTTLKEITAEKAGILKKGVPVVLGRQRPSVEGQLRRAARTVGAPVLAPTKVQPIRVRLGRDGFRLECRIRGRRCHLPVAGRHQAENLGIALGLAGAVCDLDLGRALRGLESLRLPGRIEVVGKRPRMIVDVAHNEVSTRSLRRTLEEAGIRSKILVFGTAADKDRKAMLRELLPGTRLAIFTRSSNPRAADPAGLSELAGRTPRVVAGSVARAVRLARRRARSGESVVVCGSFVVAGEAMGAGGRA